ncbi:MAG: sulfatase-like hydrolase/transferase, partial [Gammaproteobacteria bacterium]
MIALSLFVVLVLAKICVVMGRDVAIAPTTFADDALIAVLVGLTELLARKQRWVATAVYVALIGYVAINVPLARLASSAMTVQMFRASGGALSDSIAHHLTATNILLIFVIGAVASVLPFVLRRVPARVGIAVFALLIGFTIVGGMLSRGDAATRNAFNTLVRSALPRVEARAVNRDWRQSMAKDSEAAVDLQFLRRAATGRNIIIISLESTGAQYLKPYGATHDLMPNLTRLAESSVLFENTYAVYPESIKGLFSVLCSRYPAFDTDAADYGRVRTPAIAEVARSAGYRTALFH